MKKYRIIAVVNTLLLFIVCLAIWGLLTNFIHNIRFTFDESGIGFPICTEWVLNVFHFFEISLVFPWTIWALWIFGNILFLEFLFRKKADKTEFMLLHLGILAAQFFSFLILVLFICGILYTPFYIGCFGIANGETIYRLDRIFIFAFILVLLVAFALTRRLYKKHKGNKGE